MTVTHSGIKRVDIYESNYPEFQLTASSQEPFQIVFRIYDKNLKRLSVMTSTSFVGALRFRVTAPSNTVLVCAGIRKNGQESLIGTHTISSSSCIIM